MAFSVPTDVWGRETHGPSFTRKYVSSIYMYVRYTGFALFRISHMYGILDFPFSESLHVLYLSSGGFVKKKCKKALVEEQLKQTGSTVSMLL